MKKNYPIYALIFLTLSCFGCDKTSDKPNKDRNILGCSDFVVYKIIADDMVLSIRIDHAKIAFSKKLQSFENIELEDFATIKIEQNCDVDNILLNACNDVFVPLKCHSVFWKLQKGKLSFNVSKVLSSYHCIKEYLATVILYNAEFVLDGGSETRTFEKIEFNNVLVGRCGG